MMFEFATTGRIIFGRGASQQLPELARAQGRTALLVVGRDGRRYEHLIEGLRQASIQISVFNVAGEPTVGLVDEARELALEADCELIIAIGGGSVIDTGKAVATMLSHPGKVLDYLELVGGGRKLNRPCAPCIAVPTTAGTGAEVTRNAVLGVPEHKVKASLRSHYMLPQVAIVDPELTLSLPPELTGYTGMDALTQLIEPFVSNAATPLTDGVCREGLKLAARSLVAAYRDGAAVSTREDMSAAALMSGMALANARLGAVHGLAGVLGAYTGHPHGAICARLLPLVMEANLNVLRTEHPGHPALDRYAEIARILTGSLAAAAEDGLAWVQQTCNELNIPRLPAEHLGPSERAEVIPAAQRASSMQGNPIGLPDEVLEHVLTRAIG
jgi:alcohol dehydrogenase class IV